MATTLPSLQASIHIGASSVSMLVSENTEVEKTDPHCEQTGDFLEQALPVAHDIFQRGGIRRSTIERCVNILRGYMETLRELGATEETPIRVVATNIIADASNHDSFINRLHIGCGLKIDTLDEGEMTRLIYLKTRRRLRDTPSMQKRTTLVVHAGPGYTRTLLFNHGKISSYSNYRMGVYRTLEGVNARSEDTEHDGSQRRLVQEHIVSHISQIRHDYADEGIQDIVLIGYEIQHLSHALSKPGKTKSSFEALSDLSKKISTMTEEELFKKYQLDYQTAQAIVPALEINLAIAKALRVETIRLPGSDYERGLLHDLPASNSLTEGFQREVIRSTEDLAKKFRIHRAHAQQVTRLSQCLFEETQDLHLLDEHDALLLRCAALLHECGNFISTRAHHKHSQYLIRHSEIFGLGQRDIILISLIARYHRRSGPKPNHTDYRDLGAEERTRVSKLASLLRIADALDRSHTGRISQLGIAYNTKKLTITLHGISDATTERLAMRSKGNLFQDIFGLAVSIIEE